MDEEAEPAPGIAVNRAWWDEAAPEHASGGFYDLEGFAAGRDDLRPFELDELGSVDGLDLIHLQCHVGTDTLSWARHGARVAGLDFSQPAIDAARQLTADAGLEAEWFCADVYDAVEAVGERRYDVVYTGIGALCWLPDIDRWAQVVAGLLRPGGVLYLVEVHPVAGGLDEAGERIESDIIDGYFRLWDEPGGTYAAPELEKVNTEVFDRVWAISEVVTALLDVGFTLELLHEQTLTNNPIPWLEKGGDGFYRVPDGRPKVPLTFSLLARKPS